MASTNRCHQLGSWLRPHGPVSASKEVIIDAPQIAESVTMAIGDFSTLLLPVSVNANPAFQITAELLELSLASIFNSNLGRENMNDEIAIASAVAALRGPVQPRHSGMAASPARTSNRISPSNQTGQAKRFDAPPDRPHSNVRPGRSRPGISGVRRTDTQSVIALGNNYWLWCGALCLVGFAMLRAATQIGMVGGPVIVHLVWPV